MGGKGREKGPLGGPTIAEEKRTRWVKSPMKKDREASRGKKRADSLDSRFSEGERKGGLPGAGFLATSGATVDHQTLSFDRGDNFSRILVKEGVSTRRPKGRKGSEDTVRETKKPEPSDFSTSRKGARMLGSALKVNSAKCSAGGKKRRGGRGGDRTRPGKKKINTGGSPKDKNNRGCVKGWNRFFPEWKEGEEGRKKRILTKGT